jgi:hypothetical protein
MWYILEGHTPIPATIEEYTAWSRTGSFDGRKRVARTVAEGIEVSTVFLGLDHGWGDGPPLLFETMIFSSNNEDLDGYCERYATWDEAEEGHRIAERFVQETVQAAMTGRIEGR